MPVNWTPQNDRLLLLKIIETLGISVNKAASDKIAKAWPDTGDSKPSPRAILERLVKLRQLANSPNGDTSSRAGGARTPSKAIVTPSSTIKKRKAFTKQVASDESDAENHVTDAEPETPAKSRKTANKSGGKPKSDLNIMTRDSAFISTPPRTKVKQEPDAVKSPSFQHTLEFANEMAKASELRRLSVCSPTASMNNNFYSLDPGFDGGNESFLAASDFGNSTPYDNMASMNLNKSSSTSFDGTDTFANNTMHPVLLDNIDVPSTPTPSTTKKLAAVSITQSPTRRTPSARARKVSAKVSEFVRLQREDERAHGEASSMEDSQESEYEAGSDGDYI